MLGTGGDRPSRRNGVGGGGSVQGRGEGRRRDGAIGENGKELKTDDIL